MPTPALPARFDTSKGPVDVPTWLTLISVISLAVGAGCALWLAVDVRRRPPAMAIMRVVWPVCALFGGLVILWFYRAHGRAERRDESGAGGQTEGEAGEPGRHETPMAVAVAKGALHCGAGCTLGDVVAETLGFAAPGILVVVGYRSLFAERMFAVWMLDFLFAFGIGVAFQYFAIVPMRDLGGWAGIWAAVKADALSLTAWQVGMYGFMALAVFGGYRPWLGQAPSVASPVFWFTMQLAMVAGFATAYPMNWFLIRAGVKERM